MKYIYYVFILGFVVSCKEPRSNNLQEQSLEVEIVVDTIKEKFKEIHFQFYPSFIYSSMITFNVVDSTVFFHRIGMRERYNYNLYPDSVIITKAPNSIFFKLDKSTYQYLTKYITIEKEDLIDREEIILDGIFTNIFFIQNDGEIIDVELNNSKTENHRRLILKLLEEASEHTSDNYTLSYLERLGKYY